MISAVIFDFDGVIVDTEPIHYRAFQETLVPLGLGYTWEEYVGHYIGFDDRDAFREAFRSAGRSLDETELARLIARKADAFQSVIAGGVAPYPGVMELIRRLSGTLPVGLCSGALSCDIEPILRQFGLEGAFDARVTADHVVASKPDPASYTLTVRKLQEAFPGREIVPGRCIAIEDTPAGIASATGAGIPVLAVANSYPAERLTGAVRVVTSLEGIGPEFLAGLL